MTEGSFDDGNYLVRVRAQVMTRDDSTGGWVPMGGGGFSNVSVRKRVIPSDDDTKHEYLIYGKRIMDQSVVLSCTIKKDFQYNKVMPTFHHWRTGDKKFGLTFQTAADARAFDKGVRLAVEDLLDGTGESPLIHDTDVGDNDVFMTLDLPVDSRSSSGSSSGSGNGISAFQPSSTTSTIPGDVVSTTSSPYTHPHANHHHLHRMHFLCPSRTVPGASGNGSSTSGLTTSVSVGGKGINSNQSGESQSKGIGEEVWMKERSAFKDLIKEHSMIDNDKIEIMSNDPYSYVQFAKDKPARTEHEYSYPMMDSLKTCKRDSISSLKKQHAISSQPPLPNKKKKDRKKETRRHSPLARAQCRYCLEMFSEDDNQRGSCEYAPDAVLACVNTATCISCAQCMLYHCMSDAEGDFNHHPCSCDASDDHCRRRWTGLTFLSIFVPCLWCYLPLRACHHCGVSCSLCGGRHEAA